MATKAEPVRVVLELEAASEPISGSLRTERGQRSFSGWVQLTAALEEARAGTAGALQAGAGGGPAAKEE